VTTAKVEWSGDWDWRAAVSENKIVILMSLIKKIQLTKNILDQSL
jgi:hypothetical protein